MGNGIGVLSPSQPPLYRKNNLKDPLKTRNWFNSTNGIKKALPEFIVNSHVPLVAVREYNQERLRSAERTKGESFDLTIINSVDGSGSRIPLGEEKELKRIVSELGFGKLFKDPKFPSAGSSLYFTRKSVEDKITWMRPHELIDDPQMLVDGVSRNDIVQGILGDCWFLSSCAALAQRPDLMKKIIPPNQPLYGRGYRGIVYFRFWRFGRWITVYIDDFLPTIDGHLLYSRCTDSREFWVALLEKAYAKLHGSYEALEGGQAMDALVDLTSGLAERYDLADAPPDLYHFLLKASSNGAFITCSRKGDWREATTADPNGLVPGHAYTVSGVAKILLSSGEDALLVRIRNPWGNSIEWTGKWNDKDISWKKVDKATKDRLEWRQRGDGEFWMSYDDFLKEFEEVSICTLGPDFDGDGIADKPGQVKAILGEWEEGKTAGGSRNDLSKFVLNPQYLLCIEKPNNNQSIFFGSSKRCSVVISLMQKNHRSKISSGSKMLQIGFVVYQTSDPSKRLPAEHFMMNYDIGTSGPYINYREVFKRFELYQGYYVIIPATFEPNCASNFLIRVYSEGPFQLR
ncbi:calpain-A-like isoform X2 [Tachypleus tridentatus]